MTCRGVGSLLVIWMLGFSAAEAAELAVRYADGRLESLHLERLEARSDELYVSADDLSRVLELDRFWRPEVGKLVFRVGERRIQVTVDTRLVIDDKKDVLLRVPVRYGKGRVMLPLEFLSRVLVPALGRSAHFDRRALELQRSPPSSDVTRLGYEIVGDVTRVRIHLDRPFRYRVQATSRELIRLILFEAQVDAVALAQERPAPLIRSVRAEQRGGDAAIYFEVEKGLEGFRDTTTDGGRTVLLTLQRDTDRPPSAPRQVPRVAQRSSRPDSLDVILLDAGHGGHDRGVRGSGLEEKDLSLQIARQLRRSLEDQLGIQVVLVRDGDQTITAERRAEIANRAHGDLLISLHCNGWYDKEAGGFETLYVASRSSGDRSEPDSDTPEFKPWYEAQLPFADKSRFLAQSLQVELGRRLPLANRGAKEAEINLLRGVAMPAVLLEIGFLTNPGEARILVQDDFVDRLAAGVAAAVQRYEQETRGGAVPRGAGLSRGRVGAAP